MKKYSREELEKIIGILDSSDEYGMILRAKGMLEGTDGHWMYFDMVPGETEIRDGEPDVSGNVPADQDLVGTLAAEVVSEAIIRAVTCAESAYGYPAAAELKR